MKQAKKILGLLLALVMVISLALPAMAADGDDIGSITLTNATIGESYHLYKLFDVTYGETEEDGKVPTDYIATKEQKDTLEAIVGNVFQFTQITGEDNQYQVTVGKKDDGSTYSDQEVIDFINSFIRTLADGVTACTFPGAIEVTGNNENVGISDKAATANTVVWSGVPYGYYFVTSSLGSVVSVDTSNPNATITDKNDDNPDWNNEPDEPEPDNPKKDVLDGNPGTTNSESIDGEQVEIGDILTYSISYTNKGKEVEPETPTAPTEDGKEEPDQTISELVITDAPPVGTDYVKESAKAYRWKDGTLTEDSEAKVEVDLTTEIITWTFGEIAVDETVEVRFNVTVTEDALEIENKTVENDADVTVKIGENTYDMKTNKVENPVKDPDDPVKDVLAPSETDSNTMVSIDGQKVNVGDTLTYKISYTNNNTPTPDSDGSLESVVITDAAPTGTVYIDKSARGERTAETGADAEIAISTNGTITWTFKNVAIGETVDAYFDVTVTEAAQSITNKTIINDAIVNVNDGPDIKTNEVTNPVGDKPDDPNPGKVIINPDGTESTTSTGSFGDTVTFDIGVNAVNQVKQTVEKEDGTSETKLTQVLEYYIYDKLDKGFDLKPNTMVVTINGTDYTVDAVTKTITDSSGKAIGTIGYSVGTDGTVIVAKIQWANVDTSTEPHTVTAIYPNCKIHLTYDAEINTNATIAQGGNLNHVFFDYKTPLDVNPNEPDPNNPTYPKGEDLNHESEEKKTITYTYALGIQKYSAETGEPLEGAKFTAVDAGGNEIKADKATDADGKVYYNYNATGTVTEFVTDANGQIVIKGVDIGTYTFTETEAPKGYNLLTDSVSVDAKMYSSDATHNTTEWTVKRFFEAITKEEFEAGYTGDMYTKSGEGENATFTKVEPKPDTWDESTVYYKLTGTSAETTNREEGTTTITFPVNVEILEVINNAGSLLPSTGGMGTTIFYILGGILVVAAGILLVTKKRMSAER